MDTQFRPWEAAHSALTAPWSLLQLGTVRVTTQGDLPHPRQLSKASSSSKASHPGVLPPPTWACRG